MHSNIQTTKFRSLSIVIDTQTHTHVTRRCKAQLAGGKANNFARSETETFKLVSCVTLPTLKSKQYTSTHCGHEETTNIRSTDKSFDSYKLLGN